MSGRDELSTTILHHPWLPDYGGLYTGLCPACPGRMIEGGHNSPSHAAHLADAILAAGYRKPRTITTAKELNALPKRTVIRDLDGDVLVADPLTDWEMFFQQIDETYHLTAGAVVLPATVLYEPEPTK